METRRSIKAFLLFLLINAFLISTSIYAGSAINLPTRFWRVYIGPFGGIYTGSFDYQVTDFHNITPLITQVSDYIYQRGYSYGLQTGINYHMYDHSLFVGLNFSGMGNTENGSGDLDGFNGSGPIVFAYSSLNMFRLNYNLDLAAVLGVHIFRKTQAYLKGGASYAQFTHTLAILSATLPGISFQATDKNHVWGFLVGFGVTQYFCKWLNLFAEFDYYDYSNFNLRDYSNIQPPPVAAGGVSNYTQNVTIHAYSIRVGLNFDTDL